MAAGLWQPAATCQAAGFVSKELQIVDGLNDGTLLQCHPLVGWESLLPDPSWRDKRNKSPDIPAQLAFSFPYSLSSKLTRDKNMTFFLSGSCLTQLWCCEKFPIVHAWRGSHCWVSGAATPPWFFGWVEQGMPCSTALAVAVLQVACKALQLAPQGLSMCFIVPLITTIYLLLQYINRAAVYQVYVYRTWNYRLQVCRKLEEEEGIICKISWSYKYTHFPGADWYLLFAVLKQQYTLGTLRTSHLSCLPPETFLSIAEVWCTKPQHTQPL